MALYRYARTGRTSAQRDADNWSKKVAKVQSELRSFAQAERNGCLLTAADLKKIARLERQLEELSSENPYEA